MKRLHQGFRSTGFTLIELMIIIAIVAILVALAVPTYHDYTIRAKIAECIHNAAVAKVQISEYRQSLGAWPPTANDAGIFNSGDTHFCIGFTYTPGSGEFTIEVDEPVVDAGIFGQIAPLMTPLQTVGSYIDWNCSIGSTAAGNIKYLPSTCRDT